MGSVLGCPIVWFFPHRYATILWLQNNFAWNPAAAPKIPLLL
jgi:hypothetical protein